MKRLKKCINPFEIISFNIFTNDLLPFLKEKEILKISTSNKLIFKICESSILWKKIAHIKFLKKRLKQLECYYSDLKDDWKEIFKRLVKVSRYFQKEYEEMYRFLEIYNKKKRNFIQLFNFNNQAEEKTNKIINTINTNDIQLFQKLTYQEKINYEEGCRYYGEICDGKKDGCGTEFYNDGTMFIGKFKDDNIIRDISPVKVKKDENNRIIHKLEKESDDKLYKEEIEKESEMKVSLKLMKSDEDIEKKRLEREKENERLSLKFIEELERKEREERMKKKMENERLSLKLAKKLQMEDSLESFQDNEDFDNYNKSQKELINLVDTPENDDYEVDESCNDDFCFNFTQESQTQTQDTQRLSGSKDLLELDNLLKKNKHEKEKNQQNYIVKPKKQDPIFKQKNQKKQDQQDHLIKKKPQNQQNYKNNNQNNMNLKDYLKQQQNDLSQIEMSQDTQFDEYQIDLSQKYNNVGEDVKIQFKDYFKKENNDTTTSTNKEYNNYLGKNNLKFEIHLFVDSNERVNYQNGQTIEDKLKRTKLQFDIVKLNLADYIWMIKIIKIINEKKYVIKQGVLNTCIERKTQRDLEESINDERINDQTFRLKEAGIKNVYILVEGRNWENKTLFSNNFYNIQNYPKNIEDAMVEIFFQKDFKINVKRTDKFEDTIFFLKSITNNYYKKIYELIEMNIKNGVENEFQNIEKYLWKNDFFTLKDFNDYTKKEKNLRTTEIFARQIKNIECSDDVKAYHIAKKYKTPNNLYQEYNKLIYREDEKENLLEDIEIDTRYCDSKNRDENQEKISKKLSKKVYSVFKNKYYY